MKNKLPLECALAMKGLDLVSSGLNPNKWGDIIGWICMLVSSKRAPNARECLKPVPKILFGSFFRPEKWQSLL